MMRWSAEACELDRDPQSGAEITRLTCAVMSNINIYCEQPYSTPDGRRVAYLRAPSADPRVPPSQLCVADLESLRVALIDPEVASNFVATSAWSGIIYYLRSNGELVGVDLSTLEKRMVISHWDLPEHFVFQSASPDQRWLIGVQRRGESGTAIVRLDLSERTWEVIFEHEERLGHLQFNPVHGRDILVQHNRGERVDRFGARLGARPVPGGTTHFLIGAGGTDVRPLPVGPPHTASSCGHSAWVADTGRVGLTVNWKGMVFRKEDIARGELHDERHPQGNFLTVSPGDREPAVFRAPEHLFNHACVSRCGRYFVCDSYRNGVPGPIELVIGNIKTGKYRTVVSDCGAQGGGPACSHPHPYLTADNRHVIYNADPHQVCHVHAARVPAGFLEGLD